MTTVKGKTLIFPFIYNPLPGSRLFDLCLREGYLPDDFDPEDIANYFQTGIKTDQFTQAQISKLQKRAYFSNLLWLPFRSPRLLIDYYAKLILSRPDFIKSGLKHLSGVLPGSNR